MKILNLGSMNLDLVYSVDHIVKPGETEASSAMNTYLGGKGMNQSVALAKAGAEVWQGGMIGEDGQPFLDACGVYGIHAEHVRKISGKSGHAIIQIDRDAQNSILLFGGANRMLTEEYVDEVLVHFGTEDLLLLQNEVNLMPFIVERAHEKGMTVALNPSPFDSALREVDMSKIDLFILNEVEGEQITGVQEPVDMIQAMRKKFPKAKIVLTLGEEGAVYADAENLLVQPAFSVSAVDTTAAGDTFTGYFLAGLAEGMPVPEIMRMSAMASAIAVTHAGAVPSIPWREEVEDALAKA